MNILLSVSKLEILCQSQTPVSDVMAHSEQYKKTNLENPEKKTGHRGISLWFNSHVLITTGSENEISWLIFGDGHNPTMTDFFFQMSHEERAPWLFRVLFGGMKSYPVI